MHRLYLAVYNYDKQRGDELTPVAFCQLCLTRLLGLIIVDNVVTGTHKCSSCCSAASHFIRFM